MIQNTTPPRPYRIGANDGVLMIATIALTLSLLSSSEFWQISRSVIWGMGHDHPSASFDRCIRKHKRHQCKRELDIANRDACRFILKEQCKI